MEKNQGKKRYEQDGSERSREGRRPRIGSKPSGDGTFSNRSGATRPSYGERQQIRDDRNGGMNRTRTEGGYESRNRSYQSGTGRSNEYDRNRGYRSQSGGYNRSSSDTNRPQRNNRYDNNRSDNSGYRGGNDYNRRSNDQRQDGGYQRDGERSQYGRGDYQGERNNRDRGGYNNTRGHGSNFGKPFRKFENRSDNYNPNDKYSKRKQIEYKQQYIDYTKPMRLNKFMANAGM